MLKYKLPCPNGSMSRHQPIFHLCAGLTFNQRTHFSGLVEGFFVLEIWNYL